MCMTDRPKLNKVTLEYDDKTVYLTGDEAEQWRALMDAAIASSAVKGYVGKQFGWKEVEPRPVSEWATGEIMDYVKNKDREVQ